MEYKLSIRPNTLKGLASGILTTEAMTLRLTIAIKAIIEILLIYIYIRSYETKDAFRLTYT